MSNVPHGEPYAGILHVWFDEGADVSCGGVSLYSTPSLALMTIIDTLSLRNGDAVAKLIDVLNGLARDPGRDVADLLWGKTDKP